MASPAGSGQGILQLRSREYSHQTEGRLFTSPSVKRSLRKGGDQPHFGYRLPHSPIPLAHEVKFCDEFMLGQASTSFLKKLFIIIIIIIIVIIIMTTPASYGSSWAGIKLELQLPAYTTAVAT